MEETWTLLFYYWRLSSRQSEWVLGLFRVLSGVKQTLKALLNTVCFQHRQKKKKKLHPVKPRRKKCWWIRWSLLIFFFLSSSGDPHQFEQKFNYRRPMYPILKYMWGKDSYRESIKVKHHWMLWILIFGYSAFHFPKRMSCTPVLVATEEYKCWCSLLRCQQISIRTLWLKVGYNSTHNGNVSKKIECGEKLIDEWFVFIHSNLIDTGFNCSQLLESNW